MLYEEDDSTIKTTNNERGHIVSPASSNNSISKSEQVLCSTSPKSRRVKNRTSNVESTGTSVIDLEQVMSKHLSVQNSNKSYSPMLHKHGRVVQEVIAEFITVDYRTIINDRSSTTIVRQQGECDMGRMRAVGRWIACKILFFIHGDTDTYRQI